MILLPLMIIWARRPMHFPKSSRWGSLVIAFVGLCWLGPLNLQNSAAQVATTEVANGQSVNGQNVRNVPGTADKNRQRHREGTRINAVAGKFTSAGRRWIFTIDARDSAFFVLENRALERVVKAISEDDQDRHWKISGELTEYLDENYLLIDKIERAVGVKQD